jgi:predicted ThiF/HesA family dinucleotide-utilizing enzyme
MSIEKVKVVDQITVTENGIILYREATKIIEDGVELTKTLSQNFTHSRARPDWTTRTSGCDCKYCLDR